MVFKLLETPSFPMVLLDSLQIFELKYLKYFLQLKYIHKNNAKTPICYKSILTHQATPN